MFDVDSKMFDYLSTPNEQFVQAAFHSSLDTGCDREMSPEDAWKNSVVVDIGSNTGFYGLLALAHGCAVVFVEPQPECNDLISKSIAASNFDLRKVRRIKNPLGEAGKKLEVRPENHCEGRFPITNRERGYRTVVDNRSNSGQLGVTMVDYVPVMTALQSAGLGENTTLQLVKIDTEGFEPLIVEAFLPGLRNWTVLNLVVEVTPLWWVQNGFSRAAAGVLFETVARLGYRGETSYKKIGNHQEIKTFIEHGCCKLLGTIGQEDLLLEKISSPY